MVGHTGDLEACVGACSLVDKCVKELLDTVESLGGRWLLTADHGNADDMVQRAKKTNAPLFADDKSPLPLTSHTLVRAPSFLWALVQQADERSSAQFQASTVMIANNGSHCPTSPSAICCADVSPGLTCPDRAPVVPKVASRGAETTKMLQKAKSLNVYGVTSLLLTVEFRGVCRHVWFRM